MGKGQAIILLAIVAIAALFLFFSPQIFGPVTTVEPIKFKNDIITLENFQVSNLKPIKNSVVTVSFDLTNNGDKEVNDVVIDFSGTTVATDDELTIVECEGIEPTEEGKGLFGIFGKEKKCIFDKIESLDARKVTVSYKVVNEGTRAIVVKVTYPYSGIREALIPIIDDKTVRKPPVQFSQSQPSFGPFAVDIIPPTKGWGISNQPFELKFKLRFVGSSATGTPIPSIDKLKLDKNKFGVKLAGLEIAKEGRDPISCSPFKESGTINEVTYTMVNNREFKVDKEYNCNLKAPGIQSNDVFGYKLGKVEVDFFYTFNFQKSQSITVVQKA